MTKPIPCPDAVNWCTDHEPSQAAEDECHRHLLSPSVQISQQRQPAGLIQINWSTDGDSDDTVEARRIGQLLIAAADLAESIAITEYAESRLDVLITKAWERKAGVMTYVDRSAVARADRQRGL